MGDLALCSCERRGRQQTKGTNQTRPETPVSRVREQTEEACVASGYLTACDARTPGCVAAACTEGPPILGGDNTWLSGY